MESDSHRHRSLEMQVEAINSILDTKKKEADTLKTNLDCARKMDENQILKEFHSFYNSTQSLVDRYGKYRTASAHSNTRRAYSSLTSVTTYDEGSLFTWENHSAVQHHSTPNFNYGTVKPKSVNISNQNSLDLSSASDVTPCCSISNDLRTTTTSFVTLQSANESNNNSKPKLISGRCPSTMTPESHNPETLEPTYDPITKVNKWLYSISEHGNNFQTDKKSNMDFDLIEMRKIIRQREDSFTLNKDLGTCKMSIGQVKEVNEPKPMTKKKLEKVVQESDAGVNAEDSLNLELSLTQAAMKPKVVIEINLSEMRKIIQEYDDVARANQSNDLVTVDETMLESG